MIIMHTYKFYVTYDNRSFVVHMESDSLDNAVHKLLFTYPKCKYDLLTN